MNSKENIYWRWSLAFIFAGVLIRLIHIDMPLLEGAITRQIQTAVITQNLLSNGFDFLHPQINQLPEPRYFVLEPPVYNSIVAALYLVFGVHEYLGRLVSILAFVGTAIYLFKIASTNINGSVARAAVFVFSFSPLSIIFTRAFQPDPTALFFSTALIFYFVEWIQGNKAAYWPACIFGMLAFFTKQTYMFILLPLSLYGLYRQKQALLKNAKFYAFLFLTTIPAVLWVFHARSLNQLMPSYVLGGNFEVSNWFDLSTFFLYSYYKNIFQWLSGLILTPFGFSLLLAGLFVKSNRAGDALLNFWFLGVLVFYVLLPKHAYTHEYYHLPMLPVASIIIGKAWWFFFENEKTLLRNSFIAKPFKVLGLLIVAVMVFGYSNSGFKLPESVSQFYEETETLNQNTKDEDLIVVTETRYLYYGNNKGWGLSYKPREYSEIKQFWIKKGSPLPPYIDLIETWREQGAAYFFETRPEEFYQHKEFADYMLAHYPVVDQKEGVYILFNLKKKSEKPL